MHQTCSGPGGGNAIKGKGGIAHALTSVLHGRILHHMALCITASTHPP